MENPIAPEGQPALEKRGRLLLVAGSVVGIMVVGALGVYAWYAVYGPCTRSTVDAASTALFEQVAVFEQEYQAAASATPIGLMGPVTSMQQTLWDTREIDVPGCMQLARNELITSMESAIRAFLAVMNDETEQTVQDLLQDSRTHLENFAAELESINKCAPFCLLNTADEFQPTVSSTRHVKPDAPQLRYEPCASAAAGARQPARAV